MDLHNLVNLADYGINGINYYWVNRKKHCLADQELNQVGVYNADAFVHPAVIEPLQQAIRSLNAQGFTLLVKDAFRSVDTYDLIYRRRCEREGREAVDRVLNTQTMPHSTGLAIDSVLVSLVEGKEVFMRDGNDGADAYFVDFYAGKTDPKSRLYYRLQQKQLSELRAVGFKLGSKGEYFHFELPVPILTPPSRAFRESFLEAVEEFRASNTLHHLTSIDVTPETFDNFLIRRRNISDGIDLPFDWVPSNDFWLVEAGRFIGRVTIRQELLTQRHKAIGHIGYAVRPSERGKGYGKMLLSMALPFAKRLGIKNAVVSCGPHNYASQAIIHSCSGKFCRFASVEEGVLWCFLVPTS